MAENCTVENNIYDVYKCEKCGNIVEVLHGSFGALTCCKAPMVKLIANETDAATEKHIPVITRLSNGYEIKVGSTLHPMEEKHYIEWIELIVDGKSILKHLNPGDLPDVTYVCCDGVDVKARAYCNLHGLWEKSKK
jgi:superoxide reductase